MLFELGMRHLNRHKLDGLSGLIWKNGHYSFLNSRSVFSHVRKKFFVLRVVHVVRVVLSMFREAEPPFFVVGFYSFELLPAAFLHCASSLRTESIGKVSISLCNSSRSGSSGFASGRASGEVKKVRRSIPRRLSSMDACAE